jgi:hypothetical protein
VHSGVQRRTSCESIRGFARGEQKMLLVSEGRKPKLSRRTPLARATILPPPAGYGDSPVAQEFPDSESRSDFMLKLLSALNINQPVIVSPSMSAFYVLPFVTEHTEHVRAWLG